MIIANKSFPLLKISKGCQRRHLGYKRWRKAANETVIQEKEAENECTDDVAVSEETEDGRIADSDEDDFYETEMDNFSDIFDKGENDECRQIHPN